MNRLKLSRKEKLLYATPLLVLLGLPLALIMRPLADGNSFERTLQELAGPQAVDCGSSIRFDLQFDPCATAAFKAGKPFIVRHVLTPADYEYVRALVSTPQGQVRLVSYYRRHWNEKAYLRQVLWPNVIVATSGRGKQFMIYNQREMRIISETHVWR